MTALKKLNLKFLRHFQRMNIKVNYGIDRESSCDVKL